MKDLYYLRVITQAENKDFENLKDSLMTI